MKKGKEVILGVTGSIAAYKSCQIVTRLKKEGINVTVVMTEEATKFITPLSLQALSGNQVVCDIFAPPQIWEAAHISLADRADLVLIAPATACLIGKIASGISDDILTCLIAATRKKVLICPAMNDKMYLNKIVQENIEKLKRLGYKFLGPVSGRLASGDEGVGRLVPVETIVKEVKRALK